MCLIKQCDRQLFILKIHEGMERGISVLFIIFNTVVLFCPFFSIVCIFWSHYYLFHNMLVHFIFSNVWIIILYSLHPIHIFIHVFHSIICVLIVSFHHGQNKMAKYILILFLSCLVRRTSCLFCINVSLFTLSTDTSVFIQRKHTILVSSLSYRYCFSVFSSHIVVNIIIMKFIGTVIQNERVR